MGEDDRHPDSDPFGRQAPGPDYRGAIISNPRHDCAGDGGELMRRALLATALLLMLALAGGSAQAQVALDVNSGSKTSLTPWAHNVGSGLNLVMIVAVSFSATGTHITGVTWSGTSPTFSCLYAMNYGDSASSCGGDGGGSARRVEIWGAFLGTPGATSGSVTVTQSGGATVVAGSASFSGSGTFGTANGTSGTATPASLSFSGLSANAAVVDAIAISTSQPITSLGSGQTQLWKAAGTSIYGSTSYKTGAVTSMAQNWTAGTTHWAYVAVPINPAPTPGKRKGQTIVGQLYPIRGTVAPETREN